MKKSLILFLQVFLLKIFLLLHQSPLLTQDDRDVVHQAENITDIFL